jgi:hypothetical protein
MDRAGEQELKSHTLYIINIVAEPLENKYIFDFAHQLKGIGVDLAFHSVNTSESRCRRCVRDKN